MSEKRRTPNSVHLTQKDVAAAVAFYRDRLGFNLDESWPDPKDPQWASLSLDGQTLMVGGAMDPAVMKEHASDPQAMAVWKAQAEDWKQNKPGVGVTTYLMVADVDAYHKTVTAKGVRALTPPTSQFYGIRDFLVADPSGHHLAFYTNIVLTSCQSCGMPLTDSKVGQMYCGYCTNPTGNLKPYAEVLEGTIQGYFMGMQKMPRAEAEIAAREHLKRMPAWVALK